ncbi:MAG: anthranilate synthase component I family protein [Leadbetterella sp.]|nr:anthranilate synthase component I family protein [Leadbetterella sp.]
MKFNIITRTKRLLADTLTPVSIFLRIREQFPLSVILESADYHAMHNSFSYIACDPVASITIDQGEVRETYPDGSVNTYPLAHPKEAVKVLQAFSARFEHHDLNQGFISNGLFGHITYDAVQYFEDITLQGKAPENNIPEIQYRVYRYVIAVNHFKNELHLFEHTYTPEGKEPAPVQDGLETLEFFVRNPKRSTSVFRVTGGEETNIADDRMREIIHQCIRHCLRGDVFQIVPSRRFSRTFSGDDFNVYRALRSINPSPYLFYFDGGDYRIFGSSPEKQIFIKDGTAEIHPIAGTFRRTGDDQHDSQLALDLHADPKESAEHVMLVDLARNDLSRNADQVHVEVFKEVQFYSHVIHLVSKVTARMNADVNPLQLVADTFPAGTLSGSPKHNAMTIINRMEPNHRGIYGGAIGFMDFNGNFNHAIAIRTFLSKNNTLFYQAGMGVVAKSDVESEMNEIHLKLGALRKAIEMAEEI